MRREPVCADKWRGKEIIFLRHSPRTSTKKLQYRRSSNANFKNFHHVDLPDYLMFAQDDKDARSTCRAIVLIITPFVFFKMSLTCRDNFV